MSDYISREAALTVLDWDCASQDALDAIKAIPAADVVEVRHGRWVESHKHVWQLDESGNIDMWVLDHGFHNGPRCVICREAFCEHCTPDWKTTECDAEHYECSKCGNISLTKTAYCPSCGAKMDGGQDE